MSKPQNSQLYSISLWAKADGEEFQNVIAHTRCESLEELEHRFEMVTSTLCEVGVSRDSFRQSWMKASSTYKVTVVATGELGKTVMEQPLDDIEADQPLAEPPPPTVLVFLNKANLVNVAVDGKINLYIREAEACQYDENDDEVNDMFTTFWDTFPDHFLASDLPDLSEVISIHQQKQP